MGGGKSIIFEYLMKTRTRVAAIVLRDNGLLCVLHEKKGRRYYLLPGGGVEPGETDEVALKREMLEETGLAVRPGTLLFETETIAPDNSRAIVQKAYRCEAKGVLRPSQAPRVIAAEFIGRERLSDLVFYPNIKTIIGEAWDKNFLVQPVKLRIPWED